MRASCMFWLEWITYLETFEGIEGNDDFESSELLDLSPSLITPDTRLIDSLIVST